jgi:phosphoglycerate kinase
LLGGAKILDAFKMMRSALEAGAADSVLTAGLTGEIMLIAAGYDLGESTLAFLESRNLLPFVEVAHELLDEFGSSVRFPLDVALIHNGERHEMEREALPAGARIVDVGRRTVEDYCAQINGAGTIFVNGPAGVYEEHESAFGTHSLWQAVAMSAATTVIGGGDSIAAARSFDLLDQYSYVCTAGGGLVRFLAGEPLPVVEALTEAARRQRTERAKA